MADGGFKDRLGEREREIMCSDLTQLELNPLSFLVFSLHLLPCAIPSPLAFCYFLSYSCLLTHLFLIHMVSSVASQSVITFSDETPSSFLSPSFSSSLLLHLTLATLQNTNLHASSFYPSPLFLYCNSSCFLLSLL